MNQCTFTPSLPQFLSSSLCLFPPLISLCKQPSLSPPSPSTLHLKDQLSTINADLYIQLVLFRENCQTLQAQIAQYIPKKGTCCVGAHMCLCLYAHVHVHICLYMYIHTYVCTCTCICTVCSGQAVLVFICLIRMCSD